MKQKFQKYNKVFHQYESGLSTKEFSEQGAEVIGYDPIEIDNAKTLLSDKMFYAESVEEAVKDYDTALILTEWDEIRNIDLNVFKSMKSPLVIGGRNCFI